MWFNEVCVIYLIQDEDCGGRHAANSRHGGDEAHSCLPESTGKHHMINNRLIEMRVSLTYPVRVYSSSVILFGVQVYLWSVSPDDSGVKLSGEQVDSGE